MTDKLQDRLQAALGAAFTIDRELGGGGMSRVFVATESGLGRSIVVKVLPSETGSSVSVERFKREIQVAAKLQHPHIVPLLTAGETDGLPFFTMPFVKGDSLRARITKSGELSVNEAMHVLRDIASALAYAHREGIVHRDIKPENVIISGGVAVVTDFGVAKAVDSAISDGGTTRTGLTSLGVALGTPAYMAPEQATADPHVDHRADIYSFGCVAYELLAGSSPFAGRPPQQLLAAHVTEAAEPLTKRRPNVPPLLAALVMKCLEKRAGDRPQTADDLITALDSIATPSGGSAPTSARIAALPAASRGKFIAVAAGVIIVAVGGFSIWKARTVPALQTGASTMVVATPDIEYTPAISPDGKFVAYSAETPQGAKVFVRQVSGGRATPLSADLPGEHVGVSWSPDGSQVAFSVVDAFRAAGAPRDEAPIFIVPALGGVPRRFVGVGSWPAWSPSGSEIAYTTADGGIAIQSVAGGTPRIIVTAGSSPAHSVAWSPDGEYVAFAVGNRPSLMNISVNTVKVVPANGGDAVSISDSTHISVSPVWTPDGKNILYVSNRDGTRDVFQQRVSDGRPIGQPRRLTTGLNPYVISLSHEGTRLAHDVVRLSSNIWTVTMTASGVFDPATATQLTRENQRVEVMNASHDGKWLAYDSDRAGNFDIWKVPTGGGEPVQLTTDSGNDFNPSWAPDDKHLVFHSSRQGVRHIYTTSSEGNGDELIVSGPGQDYMPAWSPTGARVAFRSYTDSTSHIYVSERGSSGSWSPARAVNDDNSRNATGPRWSPDGISVVYATDQGLVVAPASGGPSRVIVEQAKLVGDVGGIAWPSPETIYVCAPLANGLLRIYSVSPSGGGLRTVFSEDPNRRMGRTDFAIAGKRLFFSLATRDADVGVLEIRK